MNKKHSGFTLLELMAVVAIIGILAAIAIPMYGDYITRSRIAEPVSELSAARVRMEQYFQDNRTYVGACAANTVAPKPTNTATFTYTCPTLTSSAFEIIAVGTGPMVGFEYRINQENVRSTRSLPAGWSGASATSTCWVLKKSGEC